MSKITGVWCCQCCGYPPDECGCDKSKPTERRRFMIPGLTVEWGGGRKPYVEWYFGWHILVVWLLFVIWRLL